MRVGLIDVDGHNGFPNLALMRISAWHKGRGDAVVWWNGFEHYDRVYMSKVFTFSHDIDTVIDADEIVRGGTGYKDYGVLPSEVEATYPDYSIYPHFKPAIGFLTRGCIRNCPWCIVPRKEGYGLPKRWQGRNSTRQNAPSVSVHPKRWRCWTLTMSRRSCSERPPAWNLTKKRSRPGSWPGWLFPAAAWKRA